MTSSEAVEHRIAVACHEVGPSIDLEAVFQAGTRGGALVAPPHPMYGGRLDNPVVVGLARGLRAAGRAVLRFNFRGTGRSQGTASADSPPADADYRAAFDALATRQPGPYVAAGYSFGAATALRVGASLAGVERLILIAPPLSMIEMPALRASALPITVIVGDDDAYAPLEPLRQLLEPLPHVALHVIDGSDHFFSTGGLDEVAEIAQRL